MIRMIVFDMAGTTVDEGNIVYKTLQESINKWGYEFSLQQVLAEGAGKEKLQAVKDILSSSYRNVDEQLAGEIHADFILNLTSAYKRFPVKPQPHAEELFYILRDRNIRIVLNTGYDSLTADSLIEKLGWKKNRDFDLLICAGDVQFNRPNPDMIRLAMHKLEVPDSKQVIKVGDSIIDIEEGKNAGCGLSIGITTGAHSYVQLQKANPDFIIHDLFELIPIIDNYNY